VDLLVLHNRVVLRNAISVDPEIFESQLLDNGNGVLNDSKKIARKACSTD
jgi:hypothetical protein